MTGERRILVFSISGAVLAGCVWLAVFFAFWLADTAVSTLSALSPLIGMACGGCGALAGGAVERRTRG